jgi:2-haloacid dehalogenase
MQLRALTFDIIGTVFDAYNGLAKGVAPLNAKYGVNVNGAAFASGSLSGYSQGVAQVISSGNWVPPDTILQNATGANLPIAQLGAEANAAVNDFFDLWHTLPPWPDVVGGMAALHQHYTLAILSNMSLATQTALRSHARLPFDRLLPAESVQHYKPNPAIYDMAISRIGVAASEILMVAAHNYDLNAARQQGLRTAFVARPTELGPAGSPKNGPDPSFDFNATSLIDLAEQLGAYLVTAPEDCLPLDPHAVRVTRLIPAPQMS